MQLLPSATSQNPSPLCGNGGVDCNASGIWRWQAGAQAASPMSRGGGCYDPHKLVVRTRGPFRVGSALCNDWGKKLEAPDLKHQA
jgi:hypothetical protein